MGVPPPPPQDQTPLKPPTMQATSNKRKKGFSKNINPELFKNIFHIPNLIQSSFHDVPAEGILFTLKQPKLLPLSALYNKYNYISVQGWLLLLHCTSMRQNADFNMCIFISKCCTNQNNVTFQVTIII